MQGDGLMHEGHGVEAESRAFPEVAGGSRAWEQLLCAHSQRELCTVPGRGTSSPSASPGKGS